MMSSETMNIITEADSQLSEGQPTWNHGADVIITIGDTALPAPLTSRLLFKFTMPNYSGVIERIRFYFYVQVRSALTLELLNLDAPQDDLWIEGTSTGAVDAEGCSWNEYLKAKSWDAAGGDFDTTPLGLGVFPGGPGQLWNYIEIPIENFNFQPGKTYTLLMRSTTEPAGHNLGIHSRENASGNKSYLTFEINIDGFEAPELSAEPISSSQLDISWSKSLLDDDNFVHYLLEQSDTGVGGWTTLATITDKDTVKYEHTGLVVQGDVDDYDEDSDTYPNGRTKYYRISVSTSGFGYTPTSSVADGTTIPAIRPISLTFTPKSKFWDEDFIDDNKAYLPYGVEAIPSWYDEDDITEEDYIDKLTVEAFFRQTSTWPGAASETNDYSPVNFDTGGIIEGDSGYKPYKIKGKIYDTGGLYRKATTDKTNEQFDVAWPAPCPVAIPDATYTPFPPPSMRGSPFAAGDLVPVDLSIAGQQIGGIIYRELFTGAVNDVGKWSYNVVNASLPAYSTGVGGAPIIVSTHNGGISSSTLYKKLRDEGVSSYNRYISKYTGGYSFKCIVRFDTNWNLGAGTQLFINLCTWVDKTIQGAGYSLQFVNGTDNLQVDQYGNFVADPVFLGSLPVASGDSPMKAANVGKFLYFEVIVSPYFGASNEGDIITIIYNIDATLAGVQNIDYETHPYIFVVTSLVHNAADQPHYTGRCSIIADSPTTAQANADFEIYLAEINGRVEVGSYGAKNLTHEQVLGLVSSPIPNFSISCAPDQASQLCYIEGRIKNQYGSQSRTGEVDDYQGDTFNNADPIAFLSVPKIGYVGTDVLIDASQSVDPEGGDLIYKYDFGDSQTLETSESNVSHQYAAVGTYTVKLIVEDEAGNDSVEVESVINIYDAIEQFELVELMSPWISINQNSPTGGGKTSLPEIDYDVVQTMEGGNRVFSLRGIHSDPDCDHSEDVRMANAESERDLFHRLKNDGTLISLDLDYFGTVKGVITEHSPSMQFDDQNAFQFSMTFQEVDTRQFGG